MTDDERRVLLRWTESGAFSDVWSGRYWQEHSRDERIAEFGRRSSEFLGREFEPNEAWEFCGANDFWVALQAGFRATVLDPSDGSR